MDFNARYQDNADEDDIDGEGDIDIIVEIIKVLNEVIINNLVMKCWILILVLKFAFHGMMVPFGK